MGEIRSYGGIGSMVILVLLAVIRTIFPQTGRSGIGRVVSEVKRVGADRVGSDRPCSLFY